MDPESVARNTVGGHIVQSTQELWVDVVQRGDAQLSERVVEEGDMICVDTDLIGPHGYGADLSRSWTVGDKKPKGEQRRLYALAHEQVLRNWQLFTPGRSFFELADLAYRMPEKYKAFEQPAIAHGSGLCNEFPLLIHSDKIRAKGHDGILEPGMVICVESYAGAPGDAEGVKLESEQLGTTGRHVGVISASSFY